MTLTTRAEAEKGEPAYETEKSAQRTDRKPTEYGIRQASVKGKKSATLTVNEIKQCKKQSAGLANKFIHVLSTAI